MPSSVDTLFISSDESYRFTVQDGMATELVIGSGADAIRAKRLPWRSQGSGIGDVCLGTS